MSQNTSDEETEDAGQLNIPLTRLGADPTGSIALSEDWIQWLPNV